MIRGLRRFNILGKKVGIQMFFILAALDSKREEYTRGELDTILKIIHNECKTRIKWERWRGRKEQVREDAAGVCGIEFSTKSARKSLKMAVPLERKHDDTTYTTKGFESVAKAIAGRAISSHLTQYEYQQQKENDKLKMEYGQTYSIIFKLICIDKIENGKNLFRLAKEEIKDLLMKHFLHIRDMVICTKHNKIRSTSYKQVEDSSFDPIRGGNIDDHSEIHFTRQMIEAKKMMEIFQENLSQKAIFVLRLLTEDRNPGEIGEILGMKNNNLWNMQQRIFKKINKLTDTNLGERIKNPDEIKDIIKLAIRGLMNKEGTHA